MAGLVLVLTVTTLVLLNALFVAAEFAVIGAPRAAVERLAEKGSWSARRAQSLLRDTRQQDRFIATTQLGIAFSSLGLGMYGEHAFAERLFSLFERLGSWAPMLAHGVASVLALLTMTYLHVVLGEMVPKALALARPQRVTLWTMPFLAATGYVLLPLVVVFERLAQLVLRMLGVKRQETSVSRYYTSEELAEVVRESQEGGLVRRESGEVVQDLFEFGERTAAEAMVPRVRIVGIPLGSWQSELRHVLTGGTLHTRYPVFKGDLDHVIGTIHARRLIQCLSEGRPVAVEMVKPIPFVPETTRLDKVLEIMRREACHMVVVMDEHGGTAGILSIEDLFEEVIGDIEEGKPKRTAIRRDADGSWHVLGTVRLDELGEALGIDLSHESADTVSGLVLMKLERPANVGDEIEEQGLKIRVTAVAGRGVKEAVVVAVTGTEPRSPDSC
jgi:CBS domain containing-hemolysin-like protein